MVATCYVYYSMPEKYYSMPEKVVMRIGNRGISHWEIAEYRFTFTLSSRG